MNKTDMIWNCTEGVIEEGKDWSIETDNEKGGGGDLVSKFLSFPLSDIN